LPPSFCFEVMNHMKCHPSCLTNSALVSLLISPHGGRLLLLLFLLQKLTEQRVPVFSHEIVPDHLRTKPDPEVEEQEKQMIAEAARIGPEVAQVRRRRRRRRWP